VNFAVDLICTSEEFLFNQLLVKHILIHSILITAMHDTTYTSTVSSEASCTPGLDLLPV